MANYTREQLIEALSAEYEWLCHDDYDPDDPTPEEHLDTLKTLSYEQLIEETSTDDVGFTLEEFMDAWT